LKDDSAVAVCVVVAVAVSLFSDAQSGTRELRTRRCRSDAVSPATAAVTPRRVIRALDTVSYVTAAASKLTPK